MVQGNGEKSVCESSCTKFEAAERRTIGIRRRRFSTRRRRPEPLHFLAMKEAAVPSAQRLLPYVMLFLGCKFKGEALSARQRLASPATPTPPGSASQARQRPTRPAAPRRPGNAPPARQRLASPAALSPLVRRPQVRQSPLRSGSARGARRRPPTPAPTSAALGCVP